MKVLYESELMKNQKHAELMAPDIAFEVLQASNGDALFFSIGTDHILYVTREVRQSGTGWDKIDLSSTLSSQHSGAAVAAKAFTLAQDPKTQVFDIALILTVAGADFLYISLNNSNVPDAWTHVSWSLVPFDALGITAPAPLTIADVYLMQVPSSDGDSLTLNCFVDILRDPTNPLKLLDRYYIQPGSSPQWSHHTLAIDLAAGSIFSCLGNRLNDWVPGIYTFGKIGGTQELIFTPQYNAFRPTSPPNAARLTLPSGSTAICSVLNSSGNTNLFVAATNGLYLFTPDNQGDLAHPVQVVLNGITAGTSILSASTLGTRTAVWGVNAQGNLFYIYCPAGEESNPSAWSAPITLCTGARAFAFYLNLNAANNVLFVHLTNEKLLQLTQDPVTTIWSQRSILLPTTSIDDMVEYNSFTTHIRVTDDNGVNVPNTQVQLTSTSPVTVYVNDVYYVLTPSLPVPVTTDATGTITVIQETESISAAFMRVSLLPSVSVDINPSSKAMEKLSAIKSGDDLGNVQITTATGTQKALVPSSVSSDDKSAAASFLTKALNVAATLPSDGSAKSSATSAAFKSRAVPHASVSAGSESTALLPQACGLSFNENRMNRMTYHEGQSVEHLILPKSVFSGLLDGIEVAAGDLYQWVKTGINELESIIIQAVGDVYYVIAKIAGTVYKALLDTVSAVVGAIEHVLQKIEVFFEDLIAWLGFLFQWDDIKRTHKVMKNVIKQYASRLTREFDKLEDSVKTTFDNLHNEVNAWAGLKDTGESIGSQNASSSDVAGSHSPQSNWALYHTKSNITSASTSHTESTSASDPLDKIVQDLKTLVDTESKDFLDAIQQIKTEIADQIQTLSAAQVVQKLIGVVTGLLLDTAKNVTVTVLDIIKIVVSTILDMLDAPINIPIISWLYKQISGDDLTFLDLICLVGAIPVTIIFKIAAGVAPYPDNAHTQALIDAPDFATITQLLSGTTNGSSNSNHQPLARLMMADAKVQAAASTSPDPSDVATGVLNIGALFGSGLVAVFALLKRTGSATKVLRIGAAASYFLFVAPNYTAWKSPSSWTTVMNDTVTLLSLGKTCADNSEALSDNEMWTNIVSPFVETCINLVWLAPAIGSIIETENPGAADWTSLASNLVFDISGILTFVTSPAIAGEPAADIAFGVTEVLTLIYGVVCTGTGIATITQ